MHKFGLEWVKCCPFCKCKIIFVWYCGKPSPKEFKSQRKLNEWLSINANLNETLATIFKTIESSAKETESEDDLKGLFDDLDVNSNKLGNTVEKRNKQLVKLLESIESLNLGKYTDNTIDEIVGDIEGAK